MPNTFDKVVILSIVTFLIYRVEREKSQGLDPSKSCSSLKTPEDVKAHLENQLKQARLAAQQVGTLYSVHIAFHSAIPSLSTQGGYHIFYMPTLF